MPTYALVAFPVEERHFQARNLNTLGVDIFAEKLICTSLARKPVVGSAGL